MKQLNRISMYLAAQLLLIALCFVGCSDTGLPNRVDLTFVRASGERTAIFRVEVAATPEERRKGMMFRRSLDANRGMLLMYPSEQEYLVSTKDVYLPLDFVFVSSKGKVVGLIQNEPPMNDVPRTIGRASNFILMFPSGTIRYLGLEDGDGVIIQGALPRAS